MWTEEQTATVSLGEFSVVLGNGISASGLAGGTASATAASEAINHGDLDAVFTSGDSRYLEIALDNGDGTIQTTDVAISPRQQGVSGETLLRTAVEAASQGTQHRLGVTGRAHAEETEMIERQVQPAVAHWATTVVSSSDFDCPVGTDPVQSASRFALVS